MNLVDLIRNGVKRGLIQPEGLPPRDTSLENDGPYDGPQGYQYGVQQIDGLIVANFKGPDQYEQAKKYLHAIRHYGAYANYRLVRRSILSAWTPFSAHELDSVLAQAPRSAAFY